MTLTLIRIDLADSTATAVFRDDDGHESNFSFRCDEHGQTHAEEIFSEAYLAVPGPDIAQAHELTRLVGGLLAVRAQPLPNGEDLAAAWAAVGDELEHDWALQQEQ
ncbi:MAG: hypothetical protein QOF57_1754 [Frankiaceae bacterium]|jgi:hypothetical protein|nr:hypothetical protein [Frankiaceae bacterium]